MAVACLGMITCDILAKPIRPDVLDRDKTKVEYIKMNLGGDALNVAVNLHHLGESVSLIGKVGGDFFGRYVIDNVSAQGINTQGILETKAEDTTISIVLTHSDGERSFVYNGGAGESLQEKDIDFDLIKKARMLSIGSAFVLPQLDGLGLRNVMERAKTYGVETIMDCCGDLDQEKFNLLKPSLQYTDIFIPSYHEAKGLTGGNDLNEISAAFLAEGVKLVIIKLGNLGCYICSQEMELTIPSFKVKAIDTTGAGDTFVAGFICAYLKGWPIPDCGKFANAAGALAVQKVGANNGITSFTQVQRIMKGQQ